MKVPLSAAWLRIDPGIEFDAPHAPRILKAGISLTDAMRRTVFSMEIDCSRSGFAAQRQFEEFFALFVYHDCVAPAATPGSSPLRPMPLYEKTAVHDLKTIGTGRYRLCEERGSPGEPVMALDAPSELLMYA